MSDQPQSPDMQAALLALLAQAQQQPAGAGAGWQQPQMQLSAMPAVNGVAVPLKLQTPIGDVRVYLQLGPEAAANPQALQSAIQALANAGLPVDAWQPRNQDGGNGWGGNGNGGYGGNRGGYGGGYNRGGYGGRRY
ncbi:MAG: hypothetical protein ABTQ25_18635 [Nitrosomonas ureae]